jgi:bacterioferritin
MFHLDMLGQCLLQLGVEPMLTAQGQFWGAHYLKYGCSPKERIIIDIQSEYDCIRSYREIIRCIDSQPIIDLLERIIRDEELHISLFEQMLPLVS